MDIPSNAFVANLDEHKSAEETEQPRTSVSSTEEGTLPSRPSEEGNKLSFVPICPTQCMCELS